MRAVAMVYMSSILAAVRKDGGSIRSRCALWFALSVELPARLALVRTDA